MSKMNLMPLRDNVVIEPQSPEETTESGIVIPDTVDKERPEQGVVVAVGPGKMNDAGERVAMSVKEGDTVLFSKYGPTKVEIGTTEYLVAKEDDILAIVS